MSLTDKVSGFMSVCGKVLRVMHLSIFGVKITNLMFGIPALILMNLI
jgi:hypothetical protein